MTTRRLGREQGTGQDVAHRASLPAWVPRPMKRASGRTETSQTPAHVRVSIRVTDTNGPRGGVDQVCNVKVVLSGLPSVVVERRHADVHAAIDVALRATEQAVRRSVRRRRMKPLRGRDSAAKGVSPW
jgi:ribosome-associated translation inhibitor RaiA